jgi:hypothetical protein
MFVKSRDSCFVFFRGHPEYEAWTLLSEYRRDVARFLARECDHYPEIPQGYFDEMSVQVPTEGDQEPAEKANGNVPNSSIGWRVNQHMAISGCRDISQLASTNRISKAEGR